MKPFYSRKESEEQISLTINRYIPIYVVLSSVVLPKLDQYISVDELLISIVEINEIFALVLGIFWGIQMFKVRKDFIAMIKNKNYTITGKALSFKDPVTYHITKKA